MTVLLYHTDAYLKEFDAQVTGHDLEQNGIYLDQTAFYPGGGGQGQDRGYFEIDGQQVPIAKIGRGNVHIIEGTLPEIGSAVHGVLDWDYRYKFMRTHTAMHILCGVVWRDYSAYVTGGAMEPLKGRMDFEFERMQKELVAEIEASVNREVEAARETRVQIFPREEAFAIPDLIRTKINLVPEGIDEIRTVEIIGLDLQADGGTHVANTSDVGFIRVVDYKSKGSINKRIYFELDA